MKCHQVFVVAVEHKVVRKKENNRRGRSVIETTEETIIKSLGMNSITHMAKEDPRRNF
jgi:hypothetical protein